MQMSDNRTKLARALGSCGILLGAPLLCGLGVYLFLLVNRGPARLSELPAPPLVVEPIVGVTPDGFFSAEYRVELSDGQDYSINWPYASTYEPADETDPWIENEPCSPEAQDDLVEEAGQINSCASAQLYGEWCPAPHVSLALAQSGDLWLHEQPQPCFIVNSILVISGAIVGLVVGVGLVIGGLIWIFVKSGSQG